MVKFRHKRNHMTVAVETQVFRLLPGDDLKKGIEKALNEQQVSAGWIVTIVGSLTRVHLRFANQPTGTVKEGFFEIVGCNGTLSINGSHIHLCVADENGQSWGGHLLDGNIVYTTAEIVIQVTDSLVFRREADGSTPWPELVIDTVK